MDITQLKYFLGSKFLINGQIQEVVMIDKDCSDGNYYFIGKWVNDSYLDNQIYVILT